MIYSLNIIGSIDVINWEHVVIDLFFKSLSLLSI